jgi:hypothetical protein
MPGYLKRPPAVQEKRKKRDGIAEGIKINIASWKKFNDHGREKWPFQRIEFFCGNPSFEIDAKTGYIVSNEQ